MPYLVLFSSVILSVMFNQTLRVGQRFHSGVVAAGAINYAIAAIVSLLVLLFTSEGAAGQARNAGVLVMSIGAFNGVFYFVHLLVVLRCYHWAGIGVTMAVTGSGAVVPVLVSWLLWGEAMGPARWLAVALLPPAMFLLRSRTETHPHLTLRGDLALAGTFLLSGLVATLHKLAQTHTGPEGLVAYQASLFAAAAVASGAYAFCRRIVPGRGDVVVGVVLGVCNAANTRLIMLVLTMLSAVVVFPTIYCSTIVIHAAVSWLAWKEQLQRRQLIGIAAALAVIVLTNIQRQHG